jgi:hypothetical protein
MRRSGITWVLAIACGWRVQLATVGWVVKQVEAQAVISPGVRANQLARLKLPEAAVAAEHATKARNIVKHAATMGARERRGRRALIPRVVTRAGTGQELRPGSSARALTGKLGGCLIRAITHPDPPFLRSAPGLFGPKSPSGSRSCPHGRGRESCKPRCRCLV